VGPGLAALAPAEQELIEAVQVSGLLQTDETAWPQQDADRLRWRWVFVGIQVVYYAVAGWGKETLQRILSGFDGWRMSDGWLAYRGYAKRLGALAAQSQGPHGQLHPRCPGLRTTGARHPASPYDSGLCGPGPLSCDLSAEPAGLLEALHRAGRRRLGHAQEKSQAFALELYNDWDAIFPVLQHPALPLTNNEPRCGS
jgi:transposase